MYAALVEVIEHGNKVAQAAGQPVKFPDNERVAVLQRLEATEQGRALGGGSRTLVLKDFLALRTFQGGELQGRVLFLGRDAGVTVFHTRDYETSNLKHPSPLFTGLFGVFHNPPFVKRGKVTRREQGAGQADHLGTGLPQIIISFVSFPVPEGFSFSAFST